MLCEVGRDEEARPLFEEIAADDFARMPRDANWHVITDLAETCALLGDAPRARRLHALLRPHAHLFPVIARAVGSSGSAEFFLGRLAATAGWTEDAIAHFERALEANMRLAARPKVALTRWRLAEVLAGRGAAGDRERAAALVRAALADVQDLGLDAFARELEGAPAAAA